MLSKTINFDGFSILSVKTTTQSGKHSLFAAIN
jgi:hypothetical protein